MLSAGIIGTVVVIYLLGIGFVRKRQYKYNAAQDYQYSFEKGINVPVSLSSSLDFSSMAKNAVLSLKLPLKTTFLGHFFQPYVEILSGTIRETSYFEHGVYGKRYVDLSGFASHQEIRLKYHFCRPEGSEATLIVFENSTISDKKVLVLAPHADDAEIAAYGLYSSAKESYIVTVTVGEEGKCDYCSAYGSKQERAMQKAKLRIHDALNVAGLGGVPQAHCAMLGYFGKSLKWMYEHPQNHAVSTSTGMNDVNVFRRVVHARFACNPTPRATWDSLVDDLYQILISIHPDIIVTAHPRIDSHSDHQYTTYALLEAMEKAAMKQASLYTYTNHHIYNEAYPYGKMGSTSVLAPAFKKPFHCTAIYSHRLSAAQQADKFYALEAMHDLRDALLVIGVKKAWHHFVKQLKREFWQRDKSYYRRAIRSNELFYITSWEELSSRSN